MFLIRHKTPTNIRPAILVVGQTPPPLHGQSLMYQSLLAEPFRNVELYHVRMAFSSSLDDIGRPRLGKVLHLAKVVAAILYHRLHGHKDMLYYPPAGPSLIPVLRDIVILLSTRWMFRTTVFHFHAAGLADYLNTLSLPLRILAKWAYRSADLSIRVASSSPHDGLKLGARHEIVIPCGIEDHAKISSLRDQNTLKRILFAGAIRPSKGVDILLDACELLFQRDISFEVELIGRAVSPEYEKLVRDRISREPLRGRVLWSGELEGNEKWQAYARADIFCFPTYYEAEALSLVVLEAMMFSLPVVTTRWRGLSDAVVDGRTGYLLPIRNAGSVADTLEILIRNESLRRAMGQEGRLVYEKQFALSRWRKDLESAWLSTLSDVRHDSQI